MNDRQALFGAVVRAATDEQPTPIEGDGNAMAELAQLHMTHPGENHALLGAALLGRQALGEQRYGRPLQRNNGRDYCADALQEALDLYGYIVAAEGVDERLFAGRVRAQELCLALVTLIAERVKIDARKSGEVDQGGNRWFPVAGELRVLVGHPRWRRQVRTLSRVEGEPLGLVHPSVAEHEVAEARASAEKSYIGRVYWTLSPITLNCLRPEEAVIVYGTDAPICRQMSEIPNIDRLLTGFTLGELWLAHADDEAALFDGVADV